MVHMKPKYDHRKRGDYWKMDWNQYDSATELHERVGLDFDRVQFSMRRARYLITRKDRDMLIYETCTLKELRNFCTARGVPRPPKHDRIPATLEKRRLIQALEHEDEEGQTFERFVQLPPELRGLIYDEYMTSFSSPDVRTHANALFCKDILPPPPAAQSCRLLRHEITPKFYDKLRFHIQCSADDPISLQQPGRLFMNGQARHALMNAPAHLLQHVSKFSLLMKVMVESDYIWDWWQVDLPLGPRYVQLWRGDFDGKRHNRKFRDGPELLQAAKLIAPVEFNVMMWRMAKRPGLMRLKNGDQDLFFDLVARVQKGVGRLPAYEALWEE